MNLPFFATDLPLSALRATSPFNVFNEFKRREGGPARRQFFPPPEEHWKGGHRAR